MVKIVEMDENVTLKLQLDEDVGPVILLNKFTVQPEDVDQFLKGFCRDYQNVHAAIWLYLCPAASWYWW